MKTLFIIAFVLVELGLAFWLLKDIAVFSLGIEQVRFNRGIPTNAAHIRSEVVNLGGPGKSYLPTEVFILPNGHPIHVIGRTNEVNALFEITNQRIVNDPAGKEIVVYRQTSFAQQYLGIGISFIVGTALCLLVLGCVRLLSDRVSKRVE